MFCKDDLIKVEKNFISKNEIKSLSEWTMNNYKTPYFIDPKMNNDKTQTRYTTRHSFNRKQEYKNLKVDYPQEVYNLQDRILKYLNLNKNNILPFPSFTDGIVTTICFPPGSCDLHKDPIYYPNTFTLHCNFCTQKPKKGGITIIENKKYEFDDSDMIIYVPSHLNHRATECIGDVPRILWVFGFFVAYEDLQRIFSIRKKYH